MKRSQAEELIDKIREAAARGYSMAAVERLLSSAGLDPFEKCTGEAHANLYVDNCSQCKPRWGVVGPREKIT